MIHCKGWFSLAPALIINMEISLNFNWADWNSRSSKIPAYFKALCNEFWSWISDSDNVIFYGVFLLQDTPARSV